LSVDCFSSLLSQVEAAVVQLKFAVLFF
jgi:hypothetical protein